MQIQKKKKHTHTTTKTTFPSLNHVNDGVINTMSWTKNT
ncbi:unnamed protein product [Arabidopsis halleri]